MNKKTFKRKVVVKNCKEDFGLGVGILYSDEVTYEDKKGWGFDHPSAINNIVNDAEELVKDVVEVILECDDGVYLKL